MPGQGTRLASCCLWTVPWARLCSSSTTTHLPIQPPTLAPACLPTRGEKLDLDKERKVRTPEEMAAEAAQLRKLFL